MTIHLVRFIVAQRIRELRLERSWSQGNLAEAAVLHRTYIDAIERTERSCGLDILARLAAALVVSPAELVAAA